MDFLLSYYDSDEEQSTEGTPLGTSLQSRECREEEPKYSKRPRLQLPSADDLLHPEGHALKKLKQGPSESLNHSGANGTAKEEDDWRKPDILGRVRSFPPQEGSYPVTVMVPVILSHSAIKQLQDFMWKLQSRMSGLYPIGFSIKSPNKGDHLHQQMIATATAAAGDMHDEKNTVCITAETFASGTQVPSTSLNSTSGSDECLHISLSRTVPVKFHLVRSLIQELTECLALCNSRLSLSLEGVKCLVNDEHTRSFVTIPLNKDSPQDLLAFKQVCRMIGAVNKAFIMHGLQVYYKDPYPHVSVAWAAGDMKILIEQVLQELLCSSSEPRQNLKTDNTSGCVSNVEHDEIRVHNQHQNESSRQISYPQISVPVETVICRVGTHSHVVWTSPDS